MIRPGWSLRLCCGVALLALSACTGASQLFPLRIAKAPEAAGSIQVEQLEGGERLVVIQLEKLPPPEEVTPGARAFVVWLLAREQPPVRAGALRYDRATRSGNLMATVPASRFTVRITSEADADIERPSNVLVAEQAVAFN